MAARTFPFARRHFVLIEPGKGGVDLSIWAAPWAPWWPVGPVTTAPDGREAMNRAMFYQDRTGAVICHAPRILTGGRA